MPNWCSNNVVLRHEDPSMISRAVSAINKGEFFMEFIKPPTDIDYNSEWYDWNVNNWGSKWDVGGEDTVEEFNEGDTEVSLYFQSAWSPPIQAYSKLEELGFNVQAYYWEVGLQFCGKYSEGNDDYYDINPEDCDNTPEWIELNIPQDIIEEFNLVEEYEYLAQM